VSRDQSKRTVQRGPASVLGEISIQPNYLFILIASIAYGSAASLFSRGSWVLQPMQDIWQHLAVIRELIHDPFSPTNPFVASNEGSRHFSPYWVSVALIARAVGWSEWQAIAVAGFFSAGVLILGIYLFGSVYYRHRWGPLALLVSMLFGWSIPLGYTGFHSWTAVAKGAAYPATLLVGMSLIAWALAIRAVEGSSRAVALLVPLAALMFAIHQLGAVIGFSVIGAIAALWPRVSLRRRLLVLVAILVGIGLSALWPYHNPIHAMLRSGNSSWPNANDFFRAYYLVALILPSGIGLVGLLRPLSPGTGRPFLAALALFTLLFLLNRYGLPIGERFIMPVVLILQIGLGSLLIRCFTGALGSSGVARATVIAVALACLLIHAALTINSARYWNALVARGETVGEEAKALSEDIPDTVPIAAYGSAAWPLVAAGQRVVSIPWPEPMIRDLSARQRAVESLFGLELTREERLAAASEWGATSLVIDERYVGGGRSKSEVLRTLAAQSEQVRRAGPLWRFDLRADAEPLFGGR
jgi:hypothetical protein